QMYGEDVDLSLKARNSGGIITYVPKSQIWHHVSSSIGGKYSFLKWKRKFRSIYKLILKYSNPLFFPFTFLLLFLNAVSNFIILSLFKIFRIK
ncbi:MAG: glycosyltransferase family 2 protein, partial [Candidatus Neomarinimicrobiota bacterium]|nr:glycosyltransferase family 2 protein [Candidatus Neomarinimicrobiota bacterium]